MSKYYYSKCKKSHNTFTKNKIYRMYDYIDFEVYYIAFDDDGNEHSVDPDRFKKLNELEESRYLTIKEISEHIE